MEKKIFVTHGITVKVLDQRDLSTLFLVFVTCEKEARRATFKGSCYSGSVYLEKFLKGEVGNYKFQTLDENYDTLLIRGKGKGRKPDSAFESMKEFIRECNRLDIKI